MANNYKIKMKDIQNKYKFKIFCAGYEYDDTELRNEISQRALISEAGRYVELELNPNTYVLTAKLKDKNNNVISTSTPIDLPLESMIVDCDYDATTKSLIITLQNGNTTSIPLGDLIDGLATEEDLNEVRDNLEVVQNELNQYKTIYNVLPKVEGNGESITLDNTGESILKLNPKGQCKQDTTTGVQCFNKNAINQELSDKVVAIDTGIKLMNIWSGGAFTNEEIVKMLKPNTTYTCRIIERITARPETRTENQVSLSLYRPASGSTPSIFITLINDSTPKQTATLNTDIEYIKTFTTPEDLTNLRLLAYTFMTSTGASGTIELKDFMIVEGTYTSSNFPSYEPYTNGASPNPQYPQDVHVVSGDNTINVCGKNLFHFESQRNTGWYSDVPNMIKEIGAYTLSINDTSLSGVWAVWFADNNGDRIGDFIKPSSSVSTPSTFNVTQEQANAPYIRILPNASGLHDIQNYKIQIEKGSTATDYEPYQSQSYSVNLGTLELCKIGNYQDYLYKDSGKWYKYNAIGKKVLDGSESWAFRTDWTLTGASVFRNSGYIAGEFETGTEGFSNYLIVVANIGSLSSYHHIRVTNSNGYGTQIFIDNDFLGITSGDTDAQKTAKLKTWLGNNNTTFYGIKPTPTTEEITDTTLISQLDALESAMSYKGQTNISQINNDAPFIIDATALKDLSNL